MRVELHTQLSVLAGVNECAGLAAWQCCDTSHLQGWLEGQMRLMQAVLMTELYAPQTGCAQSAMQHRMYQVQRDSCLVSMQFAKAAQDVHDFSCKPCGYRTHEH